MTDTCSSEIVEFLLREKTISEPLKAKAVTHMTDGLAVMLAGSRTECAKKLATYALEETGRSTSTLVGFKAKASPSLAALVNGASGHADDYDDTQLASSKDRIYGLLTHPTVPALAAALAVGEQVSCSGPELIEAFVTGFEVECKMAEAIHPKHYRGGFHTTATIGAFGAFAAAAALTELSERELRYGLGITSSLASGIRVNFGTMTKPLHAGRAAMNGVTAATLAGMGFTADQNALDGRWGFFQVLGDGYDEDSIMGKLGNPYSIVDPGATLKMYPCGSLGQPSMDALLELVEEHGLTPKNVKEVRLRAGPNILEPLRYQAPVNELEAKFSLQFGLSSILLEGKAGLREYTDEFVNSPRVREMMRRVKTINDPEIARMGTDKMRSVVEVELDDGRVVRRVAEDARGTPEKPLREEDVYSKFMECSSFALSEDESRTMYKEIKRISEYSDINEFTNLFTIA
jgi:2-methylcitrate dehydratase PrpD